MLRTLTVLLVALLAACAQKPPLVVKATGQAKSCTVSVNGEVFSGKDLNQARLQRLVEEHGRRLVVDSDSRTPYRCIGGLVFSFQLAGFRVVGVRVDGEELPSR
jgi:hypothetical protein